METAVLNPLETAAVPQVAPTVAPTPQVVVTPNVMPTDTSNNFLDMLKGINLVEVAFGILGAATLYYTMHYFKYNLTSQKLFETNFENKLDEIKIQISDLSSAVKRAEMEKEEPKKTQSDTWI